MPSANYSVAISRNMNCDFVMNDCILPNQLRLDHPSSTIESHQYHPYSVRDAPSSHPPQRPHPQNKAIIVNLPPSGIFHLRISHNIARPLCYRMRLRLRPPGCSIFASPTTFTSNLAIACVALQTPPLLTLKSTTHPNNLDLHRNHLESQVNPTAQFLLRSQAQQPPQAKENPPSSIPPLSLRPSRRWKVAASCRRKKELDRNT
jgi:hypothetical protein